MELENRGQEDVVGLIVAIPLLIIMLALAAMIYVALNGGDVSTISDWLSGFIVELVVLCVFAALGLGAIYALVGR